MALKSLLLPTLLCALCLLCSAQSPGSPGVIAVQPPAQGQRTTWIRGTAGVNEDPDRIVCTLTVNRSVDDVYSNSHLECVVGIGSAQRRYIYMDNTIPGGGINVCPYRGVNIICVATVRGMNAPDRWEMTVNDPTKGGDYKTGPF